jgi:uncharacterized protein YjbI with pentapeptide repeats
MRIQERLDILTKIFLDNTTLCNDIIIHCILPYTGFVLGPYCNMNGMDLSNETLTDLDLTGSDFLYIDTTNIKFRNCNITNIKLPYINETDEFISSYYIISGTDVKVYCGCQYERYSYNVHIDNPKYAHVS